MDSALYKMGIRMPAFFRRRDGMVRRIEIDRRRSEMKCKQVRIYAVFIGLMLIAGGFVHAGGVRIGAHGGINMPNIRGEAGDPFTEGFESRQGAFYGISVDLGLSPHFSIAAEINYSSQGGQRDGLQIITSTLLPEALPLPEGMNLYANYRNESILEYIEIPLMGRLTFGKKIRFFVNAGPYIGILVRARALTQGKSFLYMDKNGTMPIVIPPGFQPLEIDMAAETDIQDSLKDVNFGLTAGGGVAIPIGPGMVIAEGRLQWGMTTIQKDIQLSGKSRTGGFTISVGYSLSLAKPEKKG
jgi:hypothetical protein